MYQSVEDNIYSAASAAGQKWGAIAYNLERCHAEAMKLLPNASRCIQRRTAEYNAWTLLVNGNPLEDELQASTTMIALGDIKIAEKNSEIAALKKEIEVTTARWADVALAADVVKTEEKEVTALKKRSTKELNTNVKYSISTDELKTELARTKVELEEKNESYSFLLSHTDKITDDRKIEITKLKEEINALKAVGEELDTLKEMSLIPRLSLRIWVINWMEGQGTGVGASVDELGEGGEKKRIKV
ncbi:hypothetical protein ACEPPN_004792 [Leptodophora sp. 'Broadleaf-Isolate-01']